MRHHPMFALLWVALAGVAQAQGAGPATQPRSTPAPDMLPPPVTQPDAVRQAGANETERPRAQRANPLRGEMPSGHSREMSQCTDLPRESRADCVRDLMGTRGGDAEAAPAREGGMNAPRDRGLTPPR
ncbi:hypothetical protein [Eleftheria terrae]|uniref:hypothetical protein n=1 Tax=Eleftheria terrae TaxID=1597781 RepID=UPI00263A4BE6|nr:hypothetical protein [Eleftheria terrae]WKB54286.1 hypothetical protein N7L95_07830 [Eleftheria terrae]